MFKADFWVATGLGLVMTATSLVFSAQWIALAAVPCFIIAAILAIRSRRKAPPPEASKRVSTAGIINQAGKLTIRGVKVRGFDDGFRNEGGETDIQTSDFKGRDGGGNDPA